MSTRYLQILVVACFVSCSTTTQSPRWTYALTGDCNADGVVTDLEAALCEGIEAGVFPLRACAACDVDGNGSVERWEAERADWLAGVRAF